jgi:P4 family phage/plasmid primase-like protien
MEKEIKKYVKKKLVCFSIDIKQKLVKDTYKKDITYAKGWQNLSFEQCKFNTAHNGLALLTGKVNNIFVIDVDDFDHWKKFLKDNKQTEPNTVKVISGSGGCHYYFQYSDDLKDIVSTSKSFCKEYNIDIRTDGGNIIAPPSSYYNENLKKRVEYKWEKSIFEYDPIPVPEWIKNILLNKKLLRTKIIIKSTPKITKNTLYNDNSEFDSDSCSETSSENNNFVLKENKKMIMEDINDEDKLLNFTICEIELLISMLDSDKCDNYSDWINVGLCLHNISDKYLLLWEKWSQMSPKYKDGECEKQWKNFKKNKDGLSIGSLLYWAKNDNKDKYDEFIKHKKVGFLIKQKYPNDNLVLGEHRKVNDKTTYIELHNKDCIIKGEKHPDLLQPNYIDVCGNCMCIKCKHQDCHGKVYPRAQSITLTKNEMNIANNTFNIFNQPPLDDELAEFQQIDIYEDPILNELVFNSLNGESYPCAQIAFHFYQDKFMYAEDENWYIFDSHKWKCLGKKNVELRELSQQKLKSLYAQLVNHCKNEADKNKLKTLKILVKNFDNTVLRNNILFELMDIYTIKKNFKRDFLTKLDANNYLIGFNNGVYDLEAFEFREGRPNDFISMTTGYDFSFEHTDKYNDLLRFLEDIQPNKEERDYTLTYLSVGLCGNLLELFTILTGCGRNGKSKLVELLKLTFGDYFGSVQSQMFTRPRPDATAPDPGLLSLANKRVVIASEPEKNAKLNSGFIKFITGRDSTTLRNCHSNNMVDFTAKFITLLICNDIPDCDDMDNAFSKRLRTINFNTEFVDNPTKSNQKKIDVNINKNFNFWKLDFMLLLIEYYKKYTLTHQLKPADNILRWTNQYKENTDLYLQFINELLQKTDNEDDKVFCVDIYMEFKMWFKFNNPSVKIPSDKEFSKNIKKHIHIETSIRIGAKVQRGIRGYKLLSFHE